MQQLQSALGIFALLGFAWIISENRRAVSWHQAAIGLAVTFATAVLLLKVPGVTAAFAAINDAVGVIAAASRAGTSFVFGYLGGGTLAVRAQGAGRRIRARVAGAADRAGDERADHAAVLLAHSAAGRARLLLAARAHPQVGGAVGLSTAANIFLGMVEAPLFIRPYLARLTRSELFMVMTGGMAGIAGTVLVLYASLIAPIIPDAAGHFVVASVLGAPAAILISLIMVPDPSGQHTGGKLGEAGPIADEHHGRDRARAPPPGSSSCSTSAPC